MIRAARIVVVLSIGASATAVAQAGHPQHIPGESSNRQPKTHDDLQPTALPALPNGMTIQMIVDGDSIYHGKGNCSACHGVEGEGLPAAGDGLTVGLNFAQEDWVSIDSLIDAGIPQVLTRSPIQMPPRGGKSDLTREEVRRVAAYIWAISQTRGEPWPGGHPLHGSMTPFAIESTPTNIRTTPDSLLRLRKK
jgi:mono/diheme cytochrome c family protein